MVKTLKLEYPEEFGYALEYVETKDGKINRKINSEYIVALTFPNEADIFWKDWDYFNSTCTNLLDSFKKYGDPYAIELFSPYRDVNYSEDDFIEFYRRFETVFSKRKNIKILMVNGVYRAKNSTKKVSMFQSAEDLVGLCEIIEGLKFRLRLTISIKNILQGKLKRSDKSLMTPLYDKKYMIEGLHISKSFGMKEVNFIKDQNNSEYFSRFGFTDTSGILDSVSRLLFEDTPHYMVPMGVESDIELEDLCDDLLRAGFAFIRER